MTLEGLRCFCAVVELAGFHRAAVRVHKTQPAVTQQVKALERELGQMLFDRKTSRPTAAGKIVYERGLVLLRESDGLLREMEDFDESRSHDLRVGCSDTNALYLGSFGFIDRVLTAAEAAWMGSASAGGILLPSKGCYPDCDISTGIGVLDVFDFLCFQDSFVGGELYACDCDTSTGLLVCDVFDFLCFQSAFVGGCP